MRLTQLKKVTPRDKYLSKPVSNGPAIERCLIRFFRDYDAGHVAQSCLIRNWDFTRRKRKIKAL